MPEGDSLRVVASGLQRTLAGATVIRLSGTHRAVRGEGRRISGSTVESVHAVGKHLLIDFDNGWTLRTHLGMTGRWHRYPPGSRWRESPGLARVVLQTADVEAVGFALRTVELGPRSRVLKSIGHLGPDLSDPAPDVDAVVARAADSSASTAADLLLDQRVAAGIGNVIKNEALFLEHIDPHTPVAHLTDADMRRLAMRGHRLLVANAAPRARTATGDRRRGQRMWVYGRTGEPCRRCGTPISSDAPGPDGRRNYWCRVCQAPVTAQR